MAINARMWATAATVSLDLDTTGPEVNDVHLDTPPTQHAIRSTVRLSGRQAAGGGDRSTGFLCELAGPNLQATLETVEVHPVLAIGR
jgi:hypothetical protein